MDHMTSQFFSGLSPYQRYYDVMVEFLAGKENTQRNDRPDGYLQRLAPFFLPRIGIHWTKSVIVITDPPDIYISKE